MEAPESLLSQKFHNASDYGMVQGAPVTPERMFKWIFIAQNFVVQYQHLHPHNAKI